MGILIPRIPSGFDNACIFLYGFGCLAYEIVCPAGAEKKAAHILEEVQEMDLQRELKGVIPDGIVDATDLGNLQLFSQIKEWMAQEGKWKWAYL